MSAQAAASEWVLTHQIVVNQLLRLGAQFLGGRRAEANGPRAFAHSLRAAASTVHYIGNALHDPPTATQEAHTQRTRPLHAMIHNAFIALGPASQSVAATAAAAVHRRGGCK